MIDLSSWPGILAGLAVLVLGWAVRHRFGPGPLAPANPAPAPAADATLLQRLAQVLRGQGGGQGGGGQLGGGGLLGGGLVRLLDLNQDGNTDLKDLALVLVRVLAARKDLDPAAALRIQDQVLELLAPLFGPQPTPPAAAG